MKISLTTKNNLIHIGVIMIMISIIVMISVTNARYETIAKLSGKANFPNTVLKVTPLEDNQELQEAVLSLHHCYLLSIYRLPSALKFVENHNGQSLIVNGQR